MKSNAVNLVNQLFWCEKLNLDSEGCNHCYERWLFVNHDGGIEVLLPTHLLSSIDPDGQGAWITFSVEQGLCRVIRADPMIGTQSKDQFILQPLN